MGAVALQSATWAIPTGDRFDDVLDKAVALVERGDGHVLVFDVTPTEASGAALEQLYSDERQAEWVEFCSECAKADVELRGEFAKEKFTLAELDEEEQNIDRLRRWYRDLRAKDLFGAPGAAAAEQQLKTCAELLEDFAERVYEARQRP